MGMIAEMYRKYARISTKPESVRFALRLLGYDEDTIEAAMDEEVWRTSEEGKHFKLETTTGEIKAGFGGKFTGQKLGQPWGKGLSQSSIGKLKNLKADFNGRSTESIKAEHKTLSAKIKKEQAWLDNYNKQPESTKQSMAKQFEWHKNQMHPLRAKQIAFEDELKKRGESIEENTPPEPPLNLPGWAQGAKEEYQRVRIADLMDRAEKTFEQAKKPFSLQEKGLISTDERDDMLKRMGLAGYDPHASVEENIMKMDNQEMRREMLGWMSDVKDWQNNAEQMAGEKWNDADKALANALADKYGVSDFSDSFPDDRSVEGWEKGDLDCWYDLKSKAMDGPVSGREAPDELQIAAGLKEPPKQEGPDYSWFDEKGNTFMGAQLSEAIGEPMGYGHRYTQKEYAEINQKLVDKLKYGKMSPNELCYYAVDGVGQMRRALTDDPYAPLDMSRLTDAEKTRLMEICNHYESLLHPFSPSDMYSSPDELTNASLDSVDKIMKRLNGNKIRSAEAQQPLKDYLLIQEKMLLGAVPADHDALANAKKAEVQQKKAAEQAKIAQIRQEQQEFRNSDAAKQKAEKIARIAAIDVAALRSDRYNHMDVEQAANDAGLFTDGKYMVTDHTIPKYVYVDALGAYQQVVSKFPFLAGELMGFGDNYGGRGTNAACSKEPDDKTEIMINFSRIKDPVQYLADRKMSEAMKWHVPVSDDVSAVQATVTHEIGHAVANWLHRAVYGEFKTEKHGNKYTVDNQVANLLKERTMKALGLKPTVENIKNEFSEYAAASRTNSSKKREPVSNTKADEFFAEAFCELMCSKNPRRGAVEFGRQLEKFIADNKIDSMTTAQTPSTKPKIV